MLVWVVEFVGVGVGFGVDFLNSGVVVDGLRVVGVVGVVLEVLRVGGIVVVWWIYYWYYWFGVRGAEIVYGERTTVTTVI